MRLPTQQSSRAQTHPRALHIRMSSFAITTPNLKARTKYTKCDSSACIRAPGNTHLPKLHYSMQGPTCSRRRRRLGGIQYACMQGSHGPICKPFRADISRFLDFTLRKVTCHFFRLLCSRLSRCKTRAAGRFCGLRSPSRPLRLLRHFDWDDRTISFHLPAARPGRCVGRVRAFRSQSSAAALGVLR